MSSKSSFFSTQGTTSTLQNTFALSIQSALDAQLASENARDYAEQANITNALHVSDAQKYASHPSDTTFTTSSVGGSLTGQYSALHHRNSASTSVAQGMNILNGIVNNGTASLGTVITNGTASLGGVISSGTTSLNTVIFNGDTALDLVISNGTTSLGTVITDGDTALDLVISNGTASLGTVVSTGTTSLNSVVSSGTSSINTQISNFSPIDALVDTADIIWLLS